MSNDTVTLITKGTNPLNKKQAVFLSIYCETEVYKDYEEVAFKYKNIKVPLVVFFNRFDGKMGFLGGAVESGESLVKALVREVREESGYKIKNVDNLKLICSHDTPHLVTHMFALSVTFDELKTIVKNQYKAKHAFVEGTIFTTHFINYDNAKPFDNFMQNNFALSVKEEIKELITALKWDKKYNIGV